MTASPAQTQASRAPLKGLRVIEFAEVLAGPWIGQTLGDLGADVIKVERPRGDVTRKWGPPFLALSPDQDEERCAAYFCACNRSKRSIVLNLHDEDDRSLAHRLCRGADVVLQNFRPGGADAYGLDYPTLRKANPRLIYCAVSGFGQDGPKAPLPGYDYLIQALSGLMSVTGAPETGPQKVGVAVGDIIAGLYGVIATLVALHERERSGEGQMVDVALLDSLVGVMANQALNALVSGIAPNPMGNRHPNIVPYQTFALADAPVVIAVGTDTQFAALCKLLSCDSIVDDPRFANNAARVENHDALQSLLARRLGRWHRADFLKEAQALSIPCAPIMNLCETFNDPQVIHRAMEISCQGVPGVRSPLSFSKSRLRLDIPPPKLGQDSQTIRDEMEPPSLTHPAGEAS